MSRGAQAQEAQDQERRAKKGQKKQGRGGAAEGGQRAAEVEEVKHHRWRSQLICKKEVGSRVFMIDERIQ